MQEHQKDDWPLHKAECKVGSSEPMLVVVSCQHPATAPTNTNPTTSTTSLGDVCPVRPVLPSLCPTEVSPPTPCVQVFRRVGARATFYDDATQLARFPLQPSMRGELQLHAVCTLYYCWLWGYHHWRWPVDRRPQ